MPWERPSCSVGPVTLTPGAPSRQGCRQCSCAPASTGCPTLCAGAGRASGERLRSPAGGCIMIRLSTAADADAIARIYRPIVEDTAISFEVDPPPAVEIERRIATTLSIAPWLVHEDGEGRVAGYAYASRHRERAAYQWSVDVSVYVDEAHRHRGIGRALYTSLFALLRLPGFRAAGAAHQRSLCLAVMLLRRLLLGRALLRFRIFGERGSGGGDEQRGARERRNQPHLARYERHRRALWESVPRTVGIRKDRGKRRRGGARPPGGRAGLRARLRCAAAACRGFRP